MYVEMRVESFALDPMAKLPVAILKDAEGGALLPVYLAPLEAVALATGLVIRELPGAEPGDLLQHLLEKLGMSLDHVLLEEARERCFTASVRFRREDEEVTVQVRPVEALVASLKYRVPILVPEETAKSSTAVDEGNGRIRIDYPDRFTEFLESLDPSDLGKYPM